MEYRQILDAIIEHVSPLAEREFRTERVCRDLARFSDEEVAHLFEELYRGALHKLPFYLQVLESTADTGVLRKSFGPRLAHIYEVADERELLLALEWLAPLPLRRKIPKGLAVHMDLQELTLGERKWKARMASPDMLEKLLVDPDPSVIRNLLNHPRLVERDVIRICARTPNHPGVFWVVYESKRWFSRYVVKKAILNNPIAPPRLVMLTLPTMNRQDVRNLLKSPQFSPGFVRRILDEMPGAKRVGKKNAAQKETVFAASEKGEGKKSRKASKAKSGPKGKKARAEKPKDDPSSSPNADETADEASGGPEDGGRGGLLH